MQSRKKSHEIFFHSNSSRISQMSNRIKSPMRESQYFSSIKNHKNKINSQATVPIYFDQNLTISQKDNRNEQINEKQLSPKESLVVQRSKSQAMSSLYVSPFKKNHLIEESDQSSNVVSSEACEITFAKSSSFIANPQKQFISMIQTHRNSSQLTQNFKNDYGYHSHIANINNSNQKEANFGSKSSMKSTYFANSKHLIESSLTINKNQFDRKDNLIEPPMFQSQIITKRPIQSPVFFKNQFINYSHEHQLKRSLSNISIMSLKSQSSNKSGTKIHFHYISPSKNNTKNPLKLSFNKQDVKNPLNKLKKKNQSSKVKLKKSPEINNKNQAVNEYFPESKVKRNKMHRNVVSPRSNKTSLFELKKEDTQNSNIEIQKWKKVCGCRITSTGSSNETFHPTDQSISQISKGSQVFIPIHDLNLSKKQQNNSSKTTDYEEEMVKKLKQDLGLNYSYYKK